MPPTTSLQPGMTGPAVQQLQQYLVSQGLMTPAQVATGPGIYGPQTTAAVKALQQKLGVNNSTGPGYWGPLTIAAVSKGTSAPSTTATSTSTPASTAPGSDQWSSIISGNPFVSDLLKDPAQKAKFDNLPDDLKGAFLQTAVSLGKSVEAGKVINPNIEITPDKAAEFLSQATTELDPYYQEKLGALKNDFSTSISRLMEDYTTGAKRSADTFKNTLDTNAETEAGNGTAFSSGRVDRENRTVTLEQNALDDAFKSAQRNAQDNANIYERSAGNAGLRSIDIPTLTGYSASNTGVNTGPSSSLYTPLGGSAIGTIPGEEKTAIAGRSSDLESAYRSGRALDLSSLS